MLVALIFYAGVILGVIYISENWFRPGSVMRLDEQPQATIQLCDISQAPARRTAVVFKYYFIIKFHFETACIESKLPRKFLLFYIYYYMPSLLYCITSIIGLSIYRRRWLD